MILPGGKMHYRRLESLLKKFHSGKASMEETIATLKSLPFEDLGFARVDHHRALRKGFPEVIFGQGKTARQISEIAQRIVANRQHALVTRLDEPKAQEVRVRLPALRYYPDARIGALGEPPAPTADQGVI